MKKSWVWICDSEIKYGLSLSLDKQTLNLLATKYLISFALIDFYSEPTESDSL